MYRFNKYLLNSIVLMLILSTILSCRKDYLDEHPLTGLTPEAIYTSKSGFETGLYGIYDLFRFERAGTGKMENPVNTGNNNNNMMITPAIIGVDNAYSNYPAAGQPEYFFNNFGATLNPSSTDINTLFNWLYKIVNASNVIIVRSSDPTINWTAQDKNQIVGEAKLFRALAYRHLTYLFGDVPLNLGTDNSVTKNDWVRTPVADVRAQIEKDLLDAEAGMAALPPNEGRFTRGVATHYLAELYLAEGQYQKAKDKATALISSGVFSLVTNRYGVNAAKPGSAFTDMFFDGNSNRIEGNTEALFVMQNMYPTTAQGFEYNIMRRWWENRYTSISISGVAPVGYMVVNGGRGQGRFAPTKWALLNYDPADVRGSLYSFRYSWIMNTDEAVTLKVLPGVTKGDSLVVEKNIVGTGTTASIQLRYRYIMTNAATLPAGKKLGDTVRTAYLTYANEPSSDFNWPSTRKWDWAPNVSTDIQQASNGNDEIYLRLADTYLLLAEAQLDLGDAAGAATTINILRARAKAPLVTAGQINIDFILDERSRELFSEEHRRYTLLRIRDPQNPAQPIWFRRTKQYNFVAGPLIQLRDTLLPIPQETINANLGKPMPQNPGY